MVKLTWKNSELCSKRVIYLDLESQYPARVKFCINLHEKSITITLFILFTYFLISCFFDKDKHMNKPFLIFIKNLQRKHGESAEPVVLAAAVQGGVVPGPAGEVGEVKQGNPVAVNRTPGQCINFVCLDTTLSKKSPGCEDTEDVHEEASLHHVGGPHAATGAVADGVGPGGHGQHEGVADAGGRGEHQVERVGAEREGHLTNQSRVQWCHVTAGHQSRLTLERMGTRMLAQAVLLVTSVTKVETAAMMRLTSSGSRLWRREQGRQRRVLSGTHLQSI